MTSDQGLQRYTILRLLGKGGMGEVHLAQDRELGRKVALKFLPEKLSRDPAARKRFVREAKSAAALDHPFICKIYEAGESDGQHFIAMEYMEGDDLRQRLDKGPLDLAEGLRVGIEIGEALEFAHKRGIIHRDLKPANIMLTPQGHAKVMDFGLAKRVIPDDTGPSNAPTLSGRLTMEGSTIGTPDYMSPEQVRGEDVDARSDIFSFAVCLQEILTARHPFKQETTAETMSAILKAGPAALELEPGRLAKGLQRVLTKALAKSKEERHKNIGQMVAELRALQQALVPPVRRTALMAAAIALMAVVVVTVWWLGRMQAPSLPAPPPEPVTVLIADFDNGTGDEVFDSILEQAMTIGLEGAAFINSFKRGSARRVAGQIREGETDLGTEVAQLVARREAIDVIVAGSLQPEGDGYRIAVQAFDAFTGDVMAEHTREVDDRDELLGAAAMLATRIRESLADLPEGSLETAPEETFTVSSLEAMRSYATAQEAQSDGRWQDSIPHYTHAVQLDPDFGRAYAGLASSYANINKLQEAEKYYKLALAHIGRMTDREKYRSRGGYYLMIRDYQQAVQEWQSLVEQYATDEVGLANLALANFYARNMSQALEKGSRAVELYPLNTVARANLSLYAMYAGDFDTAHEQAGKVMEAYPTYELAYICQALSELGRGRPEQAVELYKKMQAASAWGATLGMTGLADLAAYQGRLKDAVELLGKGIASDEAGENPAAAARKRSALALLLLNQKKSPEAMALAQEAVKGSDEMRVLYEAGVVYARAGNEERALQVAAALGGRLQNDPRAHAKLIEGEVLLARGRIQDAVSRFREARDLADTWLGRFALGRAYLEAGAYAEATSEFENCLKRRGEATAAFLDDIPTFRHFPPVHYYLGRAQEGLGSPAAADSYRSFLALRESGDGDALVNDARRRLAESGSS